MTVPGQTTYAYHGSTFRLATQGTTTFGYDATGNLTSQTVSGATTTLTYTPDQLLATATGAGANSAHTYDADNWRLKTVDQGIPTYVVRGINGELLTEWRNPGPSGEVRDYLSAGSRLIGTIDRSSADDNGSGTGYTLAANGVPVTVSVTTPGQVATASFYGTAGQRLFLQLTNNTMGGVYVLVSVRDPSGATVLTTYAYGTIDTQTLGATGVYAIVVDSYCEMSDG